MADALERLSRDEKLASQLTAFGLMNRTNISGSVKPAPSTQASISGSVKRPPIPPPIYPQGLRSYSNGGVRPCPVKPVYLEGEGFRGWVFHSEPRRVWFTPVQTGSDRLTASIGQTGCCQFVPVRSKPDFLYSEPALARSKPFFFGGEPGHVRFVPVRPESGGTGVFLPRMAVKDVVNRRTNMKGREQKNQLNHKQQVTPPKINETVTEQVGPTCQSNIESDLGLPQEWIY